ncbi:MAG: helix-turn-helix domain-containing protein [Clostridiales bacterium]|nr:helix-turn-helix domain-containing protein [Clostridiales bacterium]
MPIRYKIDILAALKTKGYPSTRIRKEKLMGQATLTQLRHGELVSWMNIETICRLLNCQPGDILEYDPPEQEPPAPDGEE